MLESLVDDCSQAGSNLFSNGRCNVIEVTPMAPYSRIWQHFPTSDELIPAYNISLAPCASAFLNFKPSLHRNRMQNGYQEESSSANERR